MRVSRMFLPTLRQNPAEAEAVSHRLMLRAGLIRKLASGIYSFLPLGLRTFRKIESIIRQEMNRAGAQELLMSALLPAEAYMASGRWEVFGPEMFRLKDRSKRDFCLGPTHEEIFTETVRNEIKSYRALPLNLYQIQVKYRDERRPRFGLLRCREFAMKDAYSFDRDEQGLDISYGKMHDAYCRIFDRCGLEYTVVEADSGAMGGTGSEEFVVASDTGESMTAICPGCGYAANDEVAQAVPSTGERDKEEELEMGKVHTPDVGTIEELTGFFGCSPERFGKTIIYVADNEPVAVMLRGDRDVNETKLKNHLGCGSLEMADAETVTKATGADVGFAGPVGLGARIVADPEIMEINNMITGANETDYHYRNVNAGRDFSVDSVADIRNVTHGDLCPECGKRLNIEPGIEVGHIFKLGTKYSKALGCVYLDEEGNEKPMVMGSYGIGVGRTMASIIEQNHDENGIIWPASVAPYHVIIVPVNMEVKEQAVLAEKMYEELCNAGIEAVLDDRLERPGVKFKDADLTGIPVRITIGRKAADGIVEYKKRDSAAVEEIRTSEALAKLYSYINE